VIDQKRLREIIGGSPVEDRPCADNIAIALVTYFEDDPECPDDRDEETGWSVWAVERTNAALAAVANRVLTEVARTADRENANG
jgi:hypothetical protein